MTWGTTPWSKFCEVASENNMENLILGNNRVIVQKALNAALEDLEIRLQEACDKGEVLLCSMCGSKNTLLKFIKETFQYGQPDDPNGLYAILDATVPLHSCQDCKFEWFTDTAGQIKDNIAHAYLKGKGKK